MLPVNYAIANLRCCGLGETGGEGSRRYSSVGVVSVDFGGIDGSESLGFTAD